MTQTTGSEVRVVAVLTAQPGKGDELVAAWPALAAQVHAEEGCLAYALHRDLQDGDRFVVLERWASAEALQRHGASEHMKEFGQAARAFSAARPQVTVLTDEPVA